ncbi:papain family cysteine protease domain-containing protein [Ditylenchus destructor]|nr:papain family cysteine protease domain-containing protein [Ditylenchus destructor]
MHNTWLLVIPVSLLVAIDFHVPESIKTYKIYQPLSFKTPSAEQLPEEFDWRKEHKFPPVKDQQHCGSCWAFGAVGGVEAAYSLRYNESISLSEQELIDCNWEHTGCKNSWSPDKAIEYISMEGLSLSDEYPLQKRGKSGPCKKGQIFERRTFWHVPWSNVGLEMKRKVRKERFRGLRYTDVPLDEGHMKAWIVNQGPLVATLTNVPDFDGQYAISNHAVVVVGYLKDKDGNTSLIMRNSWGTDSGYEGYVYQPSILGSQITHLIGPYFNDDPMSWTNGKPDFQLSEAARNILALWLISVLLCWKILLEEEERKYPEIICTRTKKKIKSKWVKRARNWRRRQHRNR